MGDVITDESKYNTLLKELDSLKQQVKSYEMKEKKDKKEDLEVMLSEDEKTICYFPD